MKLIARAAAAFDDFRAFVKGSRFGRFVNPAIVISSTVAAAAVSVFLCDHFIVLSMANNAVQDWELANLQRAEPQDQDIVFVAIQESTLALFPYREPVDRAFLNNLLIALAAKHPRAVGLDVLFDQPTDPANDRALHNTLVHYPVPLVVSYTDDPGTVDPQQRAYLDAFVPRRLRVYPNLVDDAFHIQRQIFPGAKDTTGHYIQGFARGLTARLGVKTSKHPVPIVWHGKPREALNGTDVPAFKEFPAQVAAFLPEAWIKGKIVLIGSDVSLNDRHNTPFNFAPNVKPMTGTLIFAHSISQLIHRTPSPLMPWPVDFLLALALAAAGGGLGMRHSRLALRVGAAAAIVVMYWLLGSWIYHTTNQMIGLLSPSLALAMNFTAMDSRAGREARKQKKFIQTAFSRYVSPKVVDILIKDPARMSLGGERREMTYLFSDVANFTTFSETMDSKDLARILNAYFEGLTNLVLKHDGTFDKFIGDAIFAFFNAPLDQPDHAERAVRCALDIDDFCEKFRVERLAENLPFGITRVGLHTGPAVVGNFGSQSNFNYTAQGDSVNTASRLEGLNKMFGTRICISGSTHALCKDMPQRPVGSVVLKGKTVAIDVWQPLREGEVSESFLARYDAAYAKLKSESPEALALFEALAREAPGDPCVSFHVKRLREGEKGITMVMHEK